MVTQDNSIITNLPRIKYGAGRMWRYYKKLSGENNGMQSATEFIIEIDNY